MFDRPLTYADAKAFFPPPRTFTVQTQNKASIHSLGYSLATWSADVLMPLTVSSLAAL